MNKNILLTGLIVGLIASLAFIVAQPLLGMSTLTSRHAEAYVKLGHYSESVAFMLSWFVHISVSMVYGLISTIVYSKSASAMTNLGQIALLGWITTLIATPANEWVVKLVTSKQFPALDSLSALNTEIGAKFWLHILFFVFVVVLLWLNKKFTFSDNLLGKTASE